MEVDRTEPVVAILGAGFSAVANVPLTPDFRFGHGTLPSGPVAAP